MKNKLRCAVIGYGYMGEIRHRCIEENPNLILDNICDVKKIKIKKNIKVTRNFKDSINTNIDVVFVCVPNNLIPKIVNYSLSLGKHVFCEKPPGRSLFDIESIIRHEKKSKNSKLMFGFNHRYHPGIMRAKHLVDNKKFGEIIAIRGMYGKSGGKNFRLSWKNNPKISGGGILIDQGIHMLDLFNYFLGNFNLVKSILGNKAWKFNVEDNAMIVLKNNNGRLAMLHSSSSFWKHMFEINIILEKGYLKIDGLLSKTGSYGREKLTIGKKLFENDKSALGNPPEEIIYFDKDLSWNIEVDKFVNFILNKKVVNESNSKDALNVMKIVEKCYIDNKNFKFS